MRLRTDDEVYRVNAIWLGPPRGTFPWQARYVAYGVWIGLLLLITALERRVGIPFSFFSTAWAVVLSVALTRLVCARISHERPLGAVAVMWLHELTTPRRRTKPTGASADLARIRVRPSRPRRQTTRSHR